VAGLGAATVKKGVELLDYLFAQIVIATAEWHSLPRPDNPHIPPATKALLSLLIALVASPAAYAILLVDSGLVAFNFANLAAVTGAAFMSAWAVYQAQKYTPTLRPKRAIISSKGREAPANGGTTHLAAGARSTYSAGPSYPPSEDLPTAPLK
jgi:hypothetical protein